jgi:hypothetical protein
MKKKQSFSIMALGIIMVIIVSAVAFFSGLESTETPIFYYLLHRVQSQQ